MLMKSRIRFYKEVNQDLVKVASKLFRKTEAATGL